MACPRPDEAHRFRGRRHCSAVRTTYYWREHQRRSPASTTPVPPRHAHHAYHWRDVEELGDGPHGRLGPAGRCAYSRRRRRNVGAAWYRLFKEREPGYGFVDEQTPELRSPSCRRCRGKGYGEELLEALLAQAKQRRLRAGLAERRAGQPRPPPLRAHGFEKVGEKDGSWTMLARFDDERRLAST